MYDWKRNKNSIDENCKTELRNKKKVYNSKVKERDDEVFAWLVNSQIKGVPVSGKILRQKAIELNKSVEGPSKFQASEGWLEKFKHRKKVRSLKITGTYARKNLTHAWVKLTSKLQLFS